MSLLKSPTTCACGANHSSMDKPCHKTERKYSDTPIIRTDTGNFLAQYRDQETRKLNKFNAQQFQEVWGHYDKDGNGYIEEVELDDFLKEFITSVIQNEISDEVISQCAFAQMKEEFMAAYDDNQDGRIEIGELASILPTDEEFLLLFRRDNPCKSSVEFMKIWKKYDRDRSGFIESNELKDFLVDLLQQAKLEILDATITKYTKIILELFDKNKDSRLQLSEMARLLPIKENYLVKPLFKNSKKLHEADIDRLFKMYDEDNSGMMEDEELSALLRDLLELAREDYNDEDFSKFKRVILEEYDVNKDGKINQKELKMIIMQHVNSTVSGNEKRPYNRVVLKKKLKDFDL